MKISGAQFVIILALFGTQIARSGEEPPITTSSETTEKVPIDIFETENGFVFQSDLNHGGSFGKQYEAQTELEYAHRFLLSGNWYLRTGLLYDRFDFGKTDAPVPVHLQAMAGIIGIDYMHGDDVGAFLQIRPGFYTEEHIGLASFDCPILLGRFWTIQPDKFYVLTGVYTSFLRGGFPVGPLVGVVWVPNKKLRIMGVVPEPRVIYSINKDWDFWVGAEIAGGAFRTDHHDDYVGPHIQKLSGTQVDYSDYRAGAGFTYSPTNRIDLDLGGGYAIQRSFNYHRAGEYYRTDPAPYIRLEIKAKF